MTETTPDPLGLGRGLGRTARAAVVSMATVLVAALSHDVAGGMMPPLWALVVTAVLVAPICVWWSDREWGRSGLVAVFAAAQLLLHVAAMSSQDMAPGSGHSGHGAEAEGGGGVVMVLAHVVSVAVSVWLVGLTDRVCWVLSDLCGAWRRASDLVRRCVAPPVEVTARVGAGVVRPRPRLRPAGGVGTRAPPAY